MTGPLSCRTSPLLPGTSGSWRERSTRRSRSDHFQGLPQGAPPVIEFSPSWSTRRHLVHVLVNLSGAWMSTTDRCRTTFIARNDRICRMSVGRERQYANPNSTRIRPQVFVYQLNIASDLRKYGAADESGYTPGRITAALPPAQTCRMAPSAATLMATCASRPTPCLRGGASGTATRVMTQTRQPTRSGASNMWTPSVMRVTHP